MKSSTKIIAHRGNACGAPENTLEAFRQAVELGADGVELDVQLSSDGVPVVIHDETLERTTDGAGAVAEHSAAEITALSAGLWFQPPFPAARPPTLDAVLEVLSPAGLEIHLELKTDIHPYPGLAEAVAALVGRRALGDRVMISSFNHHTLMEVRRCAPELPSLRAGHTGMSTSPPFVSIIVDRRVRRKPDWRADVGGRGDAPVVEEPERWHCAHPHGYSA